MKNLPSSILELFDDKKNTNKKFLGVKGLYNIDLNKFKRKEQKNGQNITKADLLNKMVNAVRSGVHLKTFWDTQETLWYNDEKGIYEYGGEELIRKIIDSIDNNLTRDSKNEILDKIKIRTFEFRENFNSLDLLSVENGVIDLETLELINHNPDHLLTRGLDIKFDPDAKCPKIDRFLGEIIPEKRHIIEEMMAYCLEPHYYYHKVFMLIGEGANGKSTLLELLSVFLGEKNISHIPLQAFESSPFSMANLFGKMANIFSDLPPKALYSTGIIKTLSGGDTISADVKHRDRIDFKNCAKMIYSMNKIPMIKFDDTLALWRRFVIFKFTRSFVGKKADNKLLEKLTIPEELSGLLNLLLISLKRLRNRGFFIGDEAIQEARKDYILSSDSVHSFALWGLEENVGNRLSNSELFEGYLDFCEFHQLEAQHQQTLSKNLPIHKPKIKKWRSKKARGYKGISVKEDFTIEIEGGKRVTPVTPVTGQGVIFLQNKTICKKESHNAVFPVNPVTLSNQNLENLKETGNDQIFANLIRKELLSEENEPLTQTQLVKLVNIDNEFNNDDISECIDKLYSEGRLFSPKENHYSWVE